VRDVIGGRHGSENELRGRETDVGEKRISEADQGLVRNHCRGAAAAAAVVAAGGVL
jgi:transcription elongation factor